MITSTAEQVPKLHGIIFIDCWDESATAEKNQAVEKFYQRIVEKTSSYQFECAVNAATNLALDIADSSVYNTFSMYAWNDCSGGLAFAKARIDQLIANMCRYSHSNICTGALTTSKLLSQHFMEDGKSVVILDGLDLIFHNDWKLNSQCKNWLVVGQSWQNCVHNNNMGLKELAKLSHNFDINFYATDYSFLKNDGTCATNDDFECDTLLWGKINEFGYRLVPENLESNCFPLLRYKYLHV